MKRILAISGFAVLFTLNCTNDKPLPSGFEDLQRSYKGAVKVLELEAVDNGRYWAEPKSGLQTTLLLGKSGEAQSYLLLRITDFTAVDTATITSMTVYLHQVGRFATGAPFTAIVHPMKSDWVEESTVWSTVKDQYDPTTEWSRFEVPAVDSTWVSFALTSTLANEWKKSSTTNYGMVVDFSQADFIAGYGSSDSDVDKGYANVIYTTKAGVLDTVVVYVSQDVSLLQNLAGTPANTLERDQDRLWVDNVAGYRTLLRFNLAELPNNATIHQALLKLHVDRENSDTVSGGMALTCDAVVGDSTWSPITLLSDTLATYPVGYAFDDQETVAFSSSTALPAMNQIVQNWVLKNPPNYGMIITGGYGADAQRISVYSGKDRPEFKPSLKITYSIPPSPKF